MGERYIFFGYACFFWVVFVKKKIAAARTAAAAETRRTAIQLTVEI